jgi:dipeptidase E
MYNILALSSSRVNNGNYLQHAMHLIKQTLGEGKRKIAFIRFAAVRIHPLEYIKMVQDATAGSNYEFLLVDENNPKQTIEASDAIMVGGGNTFKLLHDIYALDIFHLIKEKVKEGTPYIGWSAGSNITGLTISTTNDMPIIQPASFNSFGFLPFQINPHYINQKQEAFHGETRDQRLEEFLLMNPGIPVIGIPEGTALRLNKDSLTYIGHDSAPFFTIDNKGIINRREIRDGEDLSFLLKNT